jgi:DNA-binding Xre family transcriptional regulator
MSYQWNLRKIMATRDMFATTDLVPLLAERGIRLSREQVFRLVTTTPQRLSLDTLAALCDSLDVGVEEGFTSLGIQKPRGGEYSAPALLDARKPSAPHGESQPTQDHSDRDCGVDDAVIGVQHTARG